MRQHKGVFLSILFTANAYAAPSNLCSAYQSCKQEAKTPIHKSESHPCQEICFTEKLIKCTKNFETLTIVQNAFCTQMISNCQDCPKKN